MIPGDTISRYRILSQLGQGGGGVVYRAEDTLLHRPVALKFLSADALTESDKHRFMNEARAAAQVQHPNICPVYDIQEADGHLFIAMACLEGETLSRKTSRGPLSIAGAVDIAIQIADGLDVAHKAGIIHRDIKSSNIIVGPDGHVSILDFGLALYLGAVRITASNQTVGTPAYMSPEQAEGRPVNHRTDIWSLGVVLYEMLTGKLPFGSGGGAHMFRAIQSEQPVSISSLRPGVPPQLQKIVETALGKSPEQRWLSAKEMQAQLRAVPKTQAEASEFDSSTQTVSIPARTSDPVRAVTAGPPPSRKPAWYAAAAVAIVAAGTYPLLHQTQPPAASGELKHVAMIPFEVIGDLPSARITSDGLVEILTSALSEQFHGKLLAVPASEIRRRAIKSAEEARRIYGVTLAITGSAQPAGDKILFTANLVNASDAAKTRIIHSGMFDYDPKDPIGSRNGAIDQVARLLELELTTTAKRQLAAGDSSNPSAYAAYLQGLGFLARYDVAGNIDQAITSFESATRLDPTFALAFARLGESYWKKARKNSDPSTAARATSMAEKAVQLNPKLGPAHVVLGLIYGASGHEDDGVRSLRRALEIDPASAEAQRELARLLSKLGRVEEAEQAYLRSIRARPTDWYGHLLLAFFYHQQNRFKEAETSLKNALNLTPDNEIVRQNLGAFYLTLGRYAESIEVLNAALKTKPSAPSLAVYGAAMYYLHRFADATAAAQAAVKLTPTSHAYWGNLGIYAKWTPGSGVDSTEALHKATGLAERLLSVAPNDFDARANLAEYRARLGDAKGAITEIARIPEFARPSRAPRLAIAYELSGRRRSAIEVVASNLKTPESLAQIRDDPDLQKLWDDPLLRKAVASAGQPLAPSVR